MSFSSNNSSDVSSLSDNTIYGSVDDTDEIDRIKNIMKDHYDLIEDPSLIKKDSYYYIIERKPDENSLSQIKVKCVENPIYNQDDKTITFTFNKETQPPSKNIMRTVIFKFGQHGIGNGDYNYFIWKKKLLSSLFGSRTSASNLGGRRKTKKTRKSRKARKARKSRKARKYK